MDQNRDNSDTAFRSAGYQDAMYMQRTRVRLPWHGIRRRWLKWRVERSMKA